MNIRTGTHYLYNESGEYFIVKILQNLSNRKEFAYNCEVVKVFEPSYAKVGDKFNCSCTKGPGSGMGGWCFWNLKDNYTKEHAKSWGFDLSIPKKVKPTMKTRKLNTT